ncbi:NERD domain-containing protein [Rossellomorea vietnamensis]|uniref:NERD domain-containing protein n=1 Tax=Rossellomorea vietnamensis TaxID=218284 RepID=A0A5D4LYN5_9BACI|nr:nuclease-related domain-containing protein [Rossellomorea vietnamensis]TYR94307.1 NERD domain-containing protein [Rossellomorea vietnamensis]
MLIKDREPSQELVMLRGLKPRLHFTNEEKNYLDYKEKGFQGELAFDKLTEPLREKMVFLNDVTLKQNNNECQIDSMAIASNKLHTFEVKNFEGDYIIKENKWFSPNNIIVKNPLLQVQRTDALLTQLLRDKGFRHTVESHLIFVNPEFHLYDIPSSLPIVYPTQLNRFMEKLNNEPVKITPSDMKLAQTLLSLHINESTYSNLPHYDYQTLQKGIACPRCLKLYSPPKYTSFYCESCHLQERTEQAVLRSMAEFQLLFPSEKLTTNRLFDWCGVFKDKRTIRKVLQGNCQQQGHGVSSYFLGGLEIELGG